MREMQERFGIELDGAVTMDLTEDFRPINQTIPALLSQLDGSDSFAVLVWKLPEGVKSVADLSADYFPESFIQCAGAADKLTVEVRLQFDGTGRLFTVGRRSRSEGKTSKVQVQWSNFDVQVEQSEAFSYQEASDIFLAYIETGAIPPVYELRGH